MAEPYRVDADYNGRFAVFDRQKKRVGGSFTFRADASRACAIANEASARALDLTIADLKDRIANPPEKPSNADV